MKTFEQYNNKEKEMEESFLELAHLDKLEIRFNFIDSKYQMFYVYNGVYIFLQDKIEKRFVVYNDVSNYFIANFYYANIKVFFNNMIKKHLNLFDYDIIT
ncbi:hypothetical protein M0Q50_02360 [bacterium]|jgi:hypothetical protein|nr:hypothetical protein [bacterium]